MHSTHQLLRTGFVSLVALLVLALPVGASAQARKDLVKVTLTHFPVLISAAVYVAKDRGFFEREGLDVTMEQVKSGVALPTSIFTGQAQFTHPTFPQVVSAMGEGKQMIMVWNLTKMATVDLFLSNEALKKVGTPTTDSLEKRYKALKGLVFSGTSPGAPATRLAYFMVRQGGYDPEKDVVFQAIGDPSAQAAALKAGRIDALPSSSPVPTLLESQGLGKIFIHAEEVPEFQGYPYNAIGVTADYARKNPEVVRSFVRAMQGAHKWMQEDKAGTVAVLRKQFSRVPDDVLSRAYDYHRQYVWTTDGSYTEAMIKRAIDFTVKSGLAKKPVEPAEGGIWTNQYIGK